MIFNSWSAFLYIFLCTLFLIINGQELTKEERKSEKEALSAFEKEKWQKALELYTTLLSVYPENREYNWRTGACIFMVTADITKALSMISYATKDDNIDGEAFYWHARILHQDYKFKDALPYYEKAEKYLPQKRATQLKLKLWKEQAQNGLNLTKNMKKINIVDKKKVLRDFFYRAYEISFTYGKVIKIPESFLSNEDKEMGFNPITCFNEESGYLFFASYRGSNNKNIFRAIKIENRWTQPSLLPPEVNTSYDDDYPFFDSYRNILYFSSEGHNSIGGFDIFMSRYDEQTNTWTKAQSIGFPINSTYDDLFFISDDEETWASFASTRNSAINEITIYKVHMSIIPQKMLLVKGILESPTSATGTLSIYDKIGKTFIGSYVINPNTKSYTIVLDTPGTYLYQVSLEGIPNFLFSTTNINMPTNAEFIIQKIIHTSTSKGKDTIIISNMEGTELLSDVQDFLTSLYKQKSAMDVNADSIAIVKQKQPKYLSSQEIEEKTLQEAKQSNIKAELDSLYKQAAFFKTFQEEKAKEIKDIEGKIQLYQERLATIDNPSDKIFIQREIEKLSSRQQTLHEQMIQSTQLLSEIESLIEIKEQFLKEEGAPIAYAVEKKESSITSSKSFTKQSTKSQESKETEPQKYNKEVPTEIEKINQGSNKEEVISEVYTSKVSVDTNIIPSAKQQSENYPSKKETIASYKPASPLTLQQYESLNKLTQNLDKEKKDLQEEIILIEKRILSIQEKISSAKDKNIKKQFQDVLLERLAYKQQKEDLLQINESIRDLLSQKMIKPDIDVEGQIVKFRDSLIEVKRKKQDSLIKLSEYVAASKDKPAREYLEKTRKQLQYDINSLNAQMFFLENFNKSYKVALEKPLFAQEKKVYFEEALPSGVSQSPIKSEKSIPFDQPQLKESFASYNLPSSHQKSPEDSLQLQIAMTDTSSQKIEQQKVIDQQLSQPPFIINDTNKPALTSTISKPFSLQEESVLKTSKSPPNDTQSIGTIKATLEYKTVDTSQTHMLSLQYKDSIYKSKQYGVERELTDIVEDTKKTTGTREISSDEPRSLSSKTHISASDTLAYKTTSVEAPAYQKSIDTLLIGSASQYAGRTHQDTLKKEHLQEKKETLESEIPLSTRISASSLDTTMSSTSLSQVKALQLPSPQKTQEDTTKIIAEFSPPKTFSESSLSIPKSATTQEYILKKRDIEFFLNLRKIVSSEEKEIIPYEDIAKKEKEFLLTPIEITSKDKSQFISFIRQESIILPLIKIESDISLYDKDNPPPKRPIEDIDVPYFAVQIGAFRNPINPQIFRGFSPIYMEYTSDGLKKYTVGNFYTLEGALAARDELKKLGYKDAFVVAYYKGKRILIKEALALIENIRSKGKKLLPAVATIEKTPSVSTPGSSSSLPTPHISYISEKSSTSSLDNISSSSTTPFIYSVQISALSRQVPLSIFKNAPDLWIYKMEKYYKYLSGKFVDYIQASAHRNELSKFYSDAFIVRIPITALPSSLSEKKGAQTISEYKVVIGPFSERVKIEVADYLLSFPPNQVKSSQHGSGVYYVITNIKTKEELQNIISKLKQLGVHNYKIEEGL